MPIELLLLLIIESFSFYTNIQYKQSQNSLVARCAAMQFQLTLHTPHGRPESILFTCTPNLLYFLLPETSWCQFQGCRSSENLVIMNLGYMNWTRLSKIL